MEHIEVERDVTELPDGSWWGMVRCLCGWVRSVEDRPNPGAVDLALHAAWVVHATGA